MHTAILFCWWSWACSNQPLILIMVVTFAITMRCFQKMNGKLTVSWIFGWFAVVNDRMSALESHTVESISTTALFTIQTWGYHLFVWKQCLFFVYFVVFLFFVWDTAIAPNSNTHSSHNKQTNNAHAHAQKALCKCVQATLHCKLHYNCCTSRTFT